jgi:sugar (pentulose or hexulose) kinase
MARPDQLLQLAADILGASVERPRIVEATALGAAILAGIGIRVYANPEEAVSAVVRVQQRFVPDDQRHALYRTRMERYRELYPLLRDYLHRLHDLPS